MQMTILELRTLIREAGKSSPVRTVYSRYADNPLDDPKRSSQIKIRVTNEMVTAALFPATNPRHLERMVKGGIFAPFNCRREFEQKDLELFPEEARSQIKPFDVLVAVKKIINDVGNLSIFAKEEQRDFLAHECAYQMIDEFASSGVDAVINVESKSSLSSKIASYVSDAFSIPQISAGTLAKTKTATDIRFDKERFERDFERREDKLLSLIEKFRDETDQEKKNKFEIEIESLQNGLNSFKKVPDLVNTAIFRMREQIRQGKVPSISGQFINIRKYIKGLHGLSNDVEFEKVLVIDDNVVKGRTMADVAASLSSAGIAADFAVGVYLPSKDYIK